MFLQLMDNADGLYALTKHQLPDVDVILDKLKEAKATGGFKRNDEWELKYSAILVQMMMLEMAELAERAQLTPHSVAGLWLSVRFKFFHVLGVIEIGEDALNALGESFVPAEAFLLACLDANYGKEFAEAFKEARAELSQKLGGDDN